MKAGGKVIGATGKIGAEAVDAARGLEKGVTVAQVKAVPKKVYAATRKLTE